MKKLLVALMLAVAAAPAGAQQGAFTPGPVFTKYGMVAPVETDVPLPQGMAFKHSLDVAKSGGEGINRGFDSVARFINMHVRAGMPRDRVQAALVVHGDAAVELTRDAFYGAKNKGRVNPSSALVAAVVAEGVPIYLCGQTAVNQAITRADLLPGVKMALSAMTAHAMLQQQGYSINPF